jgi:hypothetical protein
VPLTDFTTTDNDWKAIVQANNLVTSERAKVVAAISLREQIWAAASHISSVFAAAEHSKASTITVRASKHTCFMPRFV